MFVYFGNNQKQPPFDVSQKTPDSFSGERTCAYLHANVPMLNENRIAQRQRWRQKQQTNKNTNVKCVFVHRIKLFARNHNCRFWFFIHDEKLPIQSFIRSFMPHIPYPCVVRRENTRINLSNGTRSMTSK